MRTKISGNSRKGRGRDWWKVKEGLILGSEEFDRWQGSLESEREKDFWN